MHAVVSLLILAVAWAASFGVIGALFAWLGGKGQDEPPE